MLKPVGGESSLKHGERRLDVGSALRFRGLFDTSLFAAGRVDLKTSPEDENSNPMFATIKIRLILHLPDFYLNEMCKVSMEP